MPKQLMNYSLVSYYFRTNVRLRAFESVRILRVAGLTYTQIQKVIKKYYKLQLSQSTISEWLNKKHNPQ